MNSDRAEGSEWNVGGCILHRSKTSMFTAQSSLDESRLDARLRLMIICKSLTVVTHSLPANRERTWLTSGTDWIGLGICGDVIICKCCTEIESAMLHLTRRASISKSSSRFLRRLAV